MGSKEYVVGKYVRVTVPGGKKYLSILSTTRGVVLRYSQMQFKTATKAVEWAKNWASRVNQRAAGRYPIHKKTEDRKGRMNITFEDIDALPISS